MSQARKIVENLQSQLIEKFSDHLGPENYPVDEDIFTDFKEELRDRIRIDIRKECFKDLKFFEGIGFVQNTQNSLEEFLESCKKENNEASKNMADAMVEAMLDQVTKIDDIPDESLAGDMVFENLENLFLDLLGSYYSNIHGPFKGKFFKGIFFRSFYC